VTSVKTQYVRLTATLLAAALLPLAAFSQTTGTQTRKPVQKRPAEPTVQAQPVSVDPFDIKGLILGMSNEEVSAKISAKCNAHGLCVAIQREVAVDYKYIAGFGARSYHMSFRDGRLVRLIINSYAEGFTSLASGLMEKFGKPNEESNERVTTGGGAILQNSVISWKRVGQTLSVERFFGRADTTGLMLVDDEFDRKETEEFLDRRRKSL
jgi:hypothetical protein